MKKYLTILKTEWQRQLTYRLNFVGFRLGNLVEISSQLVVWFALFQMFPAIQGYTLNQMITYVIVGWLFSFFTTNFGFEMIVSKQITTGEISNFLLKPISYIRYILVLSVGRISMALFSSVVLQAGFILVFWRYLVAPVSFSVFFVIIPMLLLSYFINLFFAILMGLCSFWTTETDGIHYAFRYALRFFTGAFFPINLFPFSLLQIFLTFPFVYSFYVPMQLYLGKMTLHQGVVGLSIQVVWLIISYGLVKFMWKVGIKKKYEGIGI